MGPGQFRAGFGRSTQTSAQKVTTKKIDFVGNHSLMRWPVVDVEMIDTWIDTEFAFRRPACCVDGRPRLGNLIVRTNTNQPGTVKRGGMLNRPIGWPQKPSRRNPVPPPGFVSNRNDTAPA